MFWFVLAGAEPPFCDFHAAALPTKAACPAAEVARCRSELGLEAGLAQAFVSATPQAVSVKQMSSSSSPFDRTVISVPSPSPANGGAINFHYPLSLPSVILCIVFAD